MKVRDRLGDPPGLLPDRALIVAAATPLADGGRSVDLAAIDPYAELLVAGGADGVFAGGTTGEGALLDLEERRRVAERFRATAVRLLIVHAGAQTTADTVLLARHAREIGADGVAVIPPPYVRLDEDELAEHLIAAAAAAAPVPFFCYAFAARSGYPFPPAVVRRVADAADNFAGAKVSDTPFDRLAPYLDLGVPVLVGNEPLLPAALERGAVGTVSGIAAAFPEAVRAALTTPHGPAHERIVAIRDALDAAGLIAGVKHVLARRGLPVSREVRRPLLPLTPEAQAELDRRLEGLLDPH